LRDDARVGSWLFRIARQLCQQHWRKRKPVDSLDDVAEAELAADESNPAEQLVAAEQQEAFLAAFEALPEVHRSVALLHYLEEFNLAEIAEITGLPLGTVKSRLFNARKKLREQLTQELRT
jgi:RNA polymerase sigma-70 factor (ECF subfamily)